MAASESIQDFEMHGAYQEGENEITAVLYIARVIYRGVQAVFDMEW